MHAASTVTQLIKRTPNIITSCYHHPWHPLQESPPRGIIMRYYCQTLCSWTFYTTIHKVFFFFARIQNKNQLKPLDYGITGNTWKGEKGSHWKNPGQRVFKDVCLSLGLHSWPGLTLCGRCFCRVKDGAGAWVPQAEPDAAGSQAKGSQRQPGWMTSGSLCSNGYEMFISLEGEESFCEDNRAYSVL